MQLSDWTELELSTADRVIPISALCKFYRDQRAIKVRFVNNFTAAESPLPLFWPGTILDNAKIVLRNNMMTFCIIMLSLPTTIMNIYVYVTGKGNYSFIQHNPSPTLNSSVHYIIIAFIYFGIHLHLHLHYMQ